MPAYQVDPDKRVDEIARFEQALVVTRQQITKIKNEVEQNLGPDEARIFDAHLMVLEDQALIGETIREFETTGRNIETCFNNVSQRYIKAFDEINDEYLRERAGDIRDVAQRVLQNLLGQAAHHLERARRETHRRRQRHHALRRRRHQPQRGHRHRHRLGQQDEPRRHRRALAEDSRRGGRARPHHPGRQRRPGARRRLRRRGHRQSHRADAVPLRPDPDREEDLRVAPAGGQPAAGRDARRRARAAAGQHREGRGGRPGEGVPGRGRGPVPHRVPLPQFARICRARRSSLPPTRPWPRRSRRSRWSSARSTSAATSRWRASPA